MDQTAWRIFRAVNGATDGPFPTMAFFSVRTTACSQKRYFFLQKKRIQPFSSVFTILINLVQKKICKKKLKKQATNQLNRIPHKKKQQGQPLFLLTMNQPFWFFSKVTIDIWTTSSNICEVDNPGIWKCRSSESFVHVPGGGFICFLFLPLFWGNDPI